jgi:hypothetical protein
MKKLSFFLSLAIFASVSMTMLHTDNARAAFPIHAKTEPSAAKTEVTTNELQTELESAAASENQSHVIKHVEKKKSFFSKLLGHGGGKSQVIALLLVILVGGLGIHRFYLGYTWQGIVQLLTLGGCGIWALIDLIRIITGDLQPKDGSYDQTL